jgi:hypothetical protein
MPYPNTTGGGLMGYPSSVDTGQVQPFVLEEPDVTVMSGNALTLGVGYFTAIVLYAPVVVTQMRCYITAASPTGNVDMGIYDATGTNSAPNNLLGHTGAIAAVTTTFTQNLTANLSLAPGRYWLAVVETVANTVGSRGSLAASVGVNMQTSATNLTVLPATAGTVTNSIFRVGITALLSGSWS